MAEEFSKNLRNLMLEKNVRWLGVHSSGRDEDLAHAATVVFANVVSVTAESHPFPVRSEYDESRAAVAAEAFRIAGRELRSLLRPPVYLMTFGCAVKGEVTYKIPAYKIPVNYKIPWKYLFSMLSHHSFRSIDKLPLPNNGWRDTDLGPR